MKDTNLLIIGGLIIIGLIVGGAGYLFSLTTTKELDNKEQEISELNDQISQITADNEELEKQVDELQEKIEQLKEKTTKKTEEKSTEEDEDEQQTKEGKNYIDVVFPDGGETFCLGKKAAVQWKCSESIETASISIYKPIEGAKRIETVPAHEGGGESVSGTYLWNVGETAHFGMVEPDDTYRMQISSNDVVKGTEPRFVYDQGEGIFTIEKCEE